MTDLKTLEQRSAILRAELSSLAQADEPDNELIKSALSEQETVSLQLAALIAADGHIEPDPDGDGEEKELDKLIARASMHNYMERAAVGREVTGAEKELNQAIKCEKEGGFPLMMLAPREGERIERADAKTSITGDTTVTPSSWIERLFAGSVLSHLMIKPTMVMPGVRNYPLVTSSIAAKSLGKSEAQDAQEYAISTTELAPVRCAANVIYSEEDQYKIPGLSQHIMTEISGALVDAMSKEIVNGADDSSSATLIEGILESSTPLKFDGTSDGNLTTATPANDVLKNLLKLVDGIYAKMPSDLRVLVSTVLYSYWGSLLSTGTSPRQFFTEILSDQKSIMAEGTDHISEIGTSGGAVGDSYAIISKKRGIAGASACPVWAEGTVIRDSFSASTAAETRIVLSSYWNFKVIRDANFLVRRFARS